MQFSCFTWRCAQETESLIVGPTWMAMLSIFVDSIYYAYGESDHVINQANNHSHWYMHIKSAMTSLCSSCAGMGDAAQAAFIWSCLVDILETAEASC